MRLGDRKITRSPDFKISLLNLISQVESDDELRSLD